MFPADEPLDDEGIAAASALRAFVRRADHVLSSPAKRTQQTAEALGLVATIDDGLCECDFGSWTGLSIDDVRAQNAGSIDAWLADPASAPHGGETLADVAARVRAFLDQARAFGGTTIAVTHGGVIRVALVLARGEPLDRVWSTMVEPLSFTELRLARGRWRVAGGGTYTRRARAWARVLRRPAKSG